MSEPIFYEIIKAPASSIVVFVCACFWILTSTNRLSFEDIGITYEKIVRDWQFWRVFTASLAHANLLHLAFNMTSLWSCRFVEFTELGFLFYMRTSFLLLVGSVLVMLVIYHILITQFGKDHYRNSLAVGYSWYSQKQLSATCVADYPLPKPPLQAISLLFVAFVSTHL